MRSAFAVAGFLVLGSSAWAAMPERGLPQYREGEVLVTYRDGADAIPARDLRSRLGLLRTRRLLHGRAEVLRLPGFATTAGALALLNREPAVAHAEPNFLRYPRALPNDTYFGDQWGLRNTGQANFVPGGPAGVPGADMDMIAAWDPVGDGSYPRVGDPLVVVAIVDDAFDIDHPDLAPNLYTNAGDPAGGGDDDANGLVDDTHGWDFAQDDNNPRASNAGLQTHGTLVAGCAVARGNNGIGVAGTAWNASLLPLKVSRIESFGGASTVVFDSAAIIDAFDYARLEGAHIVNASFGGPSYSQAEFDAVDRLRQAGVLLVAAAGNDDSNTDVAQLNYPANFDAANIVSVAATNRQDNIASFSQYGAITADVAAPGLQIVTTAYGASFALSPGISGTSFSAPYTAGVAALIRSVHPSATAGEIKARLIEGAEPAGEVNLRTAGGRVNAAQALDVSPRPALVIKAVDWIDANEALDPGETLSVDITLENLWQPAGNVSGTLSADANVTVTSGAVSFGSIAAGATATARFDLTVAGGITDHRYVHFTLAVTADNGYAASRGFIAEIGRLQSDVTVTQQFVGRDVDLYDEFHAWHYDVGTLPAGHTQLVIETTSSAPGLSSPDIDLLVKRGEPPRYNITVGTNPEEPGVFCTSGTTPDCLDPAVFMSAGFDGNERVVISNPTGTYHVVIVNFEQLDGPLTYTLRAYTRAAPAASRGGGGGELPPATLALLAGLAALRRARRAA